MQINLDFDAFYKNGVALAKLGKHKDAVECFDKALEINPNHRKTLSKQGILLAKLGKDEEAVVCFDKALEINPNEFDILSNKDLVLAKLESKPLSLKLKH